MIYTVTLNPSVDYFMKVTDAEFKDVNRVQEYSFVAAGKGINCSKILDVLGIASKAVYFAGGRTGDFITQSLRQYGHIESVPVKTDGLTRINVKLYGAVDNAFNASGPLINEDAVREMLSILEKISEDDAVIISGSLPRGIDREYVKQLCRKIRKARVILDVPEMVLDDFRGLDIWLIKPNRDELEHILSRKIKDSSDYSKAVQSILEAGVGNVLLSLGKEGAYYKGEYGEYEVKVPEVKLVKTIAAGDSMLAGFVGTILETQDIEKSLRMAAGSGSAAVSSEGLADRDTIYKLAESVEVKKIQNT